MHCNSDGDPIAAAFAEAAGLLQGHQRGDARLMRLAELAAVLKAHLPAFPRGARAFVAAGNVSAQLAAGNALELYIAHDSQENRRAALAAVAQGAVAYGDRPHSTGAAALDAEAITVLRELLQQRPRLVTTYELEASTRLTRKTIGARLARLIELGFAARPNGKRGGATITAEGMRVLGASAQDYPNITP